MQCLVLTWVGSVRFEGADEDEDIAKPAALFQIPDPTAGLFGSCAGEVKAVGRKHADYLVRR